MLLPLEDARSFVLSLCPAGPVGTVPVDEARGLVLAADVRSSEAVPPFANTAMDGFAVRSADTQGAPVELRVVATLAAGQAPDIEVGTGEAVRIMTGAPMPPGADAIIMVEKTTLADDGTVVTVDEAVSVGNHVRDAGEDVQPGDRVFEAGTVLHAGHLGVLASLGVYDVPAVPRLRVAVMSTGDELIDGPEPLAMGQIRDSNRHTLLALLAETGVEGVDLGLIRDDEASIRSALTDAAATCDAVITSGGVSMGAFDYVKVVLDDIGDMRWMQIAIKPAKPLAAGTVGGTPVFGLPGNPVSSMVSYELFARPGLLQMMGHPNPVRSKVTAIATDDLRRHRGDGKTHFARVVATMDDDGRYRVRSAGGQGSHQLSAMAHANALAVIPDTDTGGVEAGGDVHILLLRQPD